MANATILNSRRWWILLLASISSIIFLLTLWMSTSRALVVSNLPATASKTTRFAKPHNITIVGLVFFGRRATVEILRCYLERNLVVNGGWLDEIHWVQNTHNQDDLAYLDEILATSTSHKKIELNFGLTGDQSFENAWTYLERGKLYVKIDDDVTWFEDTTISSIVTLKLKHPEYFLVSANMINNPLMGWVHFHMGAVHSYLPEMSNESNSSPSTSTTSRPLHPWRYTEYPAWSGPKEFSFSINADPPSSDHRWLRIPNSSSTANAGERTPISQSEYATWGASLKSWAIASQQHYSLLENLADNRLDRYKFGKPWITNYDRLSINFVALWADEVLDNLPMDETDEAWLTTSLPRKLGKSVVVDSEALAAHFSFAFQLGVKETDLLGRYRSYAVENMCGAFMRDF